MGLWGRSQKTLKSIKDENERLRDVIREINYQTEERRTQELEMKKSSMTITIPLATQEPTGQFPR